MRTIAKAGSFFSELEISIKGVVLVGRQSREVEGEVASLCDCGLNAHVGVKRRIPDRSVNPATSVRGGSVVFAIAVLVRIFVFALVIWFIANPNRVVQRFS
jgi:hypothetical protein